MCQSLCLAVLGAPVAGTFPEAVLLSLSIVRCSGVVMGPTLEQLGKGSRRQICSSAGPSGGGGSQQTAWPETVGPYCS